MTKDMFKKIRDTKGTFHAKMGSIKDRNAMDLTESEVAQSCPIHSNPMDCSLPGSSIHGIFQARVLEQVAISFSRGSSQPRVRAWVFCIVDRRFTIWATRDIKQKILRRGGKNTQYYTKQIFMMQITTMVWSLT